MDLVAFICNKPLDIVTGRSQLVRISHNIPPNLMFDHGAPQVCVLIHLLYSLHIYDYVSKYKANSIFKIPPVVGQINNNNNTKYRLRTSCNGVRTTT